MTEPRVRYFDASGREMSHEEVEAQCKEMRKVPLGIKLLLLLAIGAAVLAAIALVMTIIKMVT